MLLPADVHQRPATTAALLLSQVAMHQVIGVLALSCLIILGECAAVDKEKSAEDTKQKRELANNYEVRPHDQLAQEQNAQNQQHYQYTFQTGYKHQTTEENNESRGVPPASNLKKVYVIPNQGRTRYATMAPQVQIAPVSEYNEDPNRQYQHNDQQQKYVYINLMPQQRPQEPQNNQQLFYPHQNVLNQGHAYHAQTVNDGVQKYQFVPYEYEHNYFQNQDVHQLQQAQPPQYEQQQRPLLHIKLLSYESKQQNNHAESDRILEQYAPQYSNQQQPMELSELIAKVRDQQREEHLHFEAIAKLQNHAQNEHGQQITENDANKSELIDKINAANYEARSQAEAYAKSQNDASQHQEQHNEPNELINKINLEKLQAHAQIEAIAKSPPVVVHKDISILRRKPINIIKAVHVPVPTPVLIPVPQPYEQLIPQPYPVPIEILRPVIIPIKKTETIEVEKPVPVEVKKIVEVPVEKKIYYKVEKPVPVEKTVHVKITKEIPVEVPIYKPQRLTILRHIWEH